MAETTQTLTRYDRVVEILDRAAGSTETEYGGAGSRFWFPLADLLEARVHGVAMIAPEEKAEDACPCCVPAAKSGDGPPFPGRGAKSGLVRGLRGQAPFDGTRFPRLPWGGKTVAPDDIELISDWIDDGCPASDVETSYGAPVQTISTDLATVAADNVESVARTFEVFEGAPNEYRYQYGEAKQRMNLDCLSPAQLERFRNAFRELYRLNKWPEDRKSVV